MKITPRENRRHAAGKEEGKRKLAREMQYARTLKRKKAILEAGLELVECWEHDFHEKPIYLKKKTRTLPHAIVYDFEALLDSSKRLQPTKDLRFENENVPVSVSLADTLHRNPEHMCLKDPEELVKKFWEAIVRRAAAIREEIQRYIPKDFDFLPEHQQKLICKWCFQIPVLGFN